MRKMFVSWNGEIREVSSIVEKFKDVIEKMGINLVDVHDPTEALLLASNASGNTVPELLSF